jgi:hypothetical protein
MEFEMNKLSAGGIAALLALGLSAAVVAPANAAPYWWYHHHHHGGYWGGPGPAIGAGILGFAAGAAIAGAAESNHRDHVDACFSAYRSYDPRTDTYLGYDGYRHRCML